MNTDAETPDDIWAGPEEIAVEVDSTGRSSGVEREEVEGEGINEPFVPERIDVVTRNPTVDLLLSRIRRGVLDLEPDFQRGVDLWPARDQSRLIESMLLRIPLPAFYAAELEDERWVIVDGAQRLTTMARFVQPDSIGAESLVLHGLEYLKPYEGKRFGELPGRMQTRLLETEIVLHLIRPGTPPAVKFNIFTRLNTGGRTLSRQELRHALIPGESRDLLRALAESDAFQNATGRSVSPNRMDDREMVLRFIAFWLHPPSEYTRQDFDEFLRETMRAVNELDTGQMSELRTAFTRAMDSAYRIFGEHAFRKPLEGQRRSGPVNKALFESVSVNLARRTDAELENLITHRDRIQEELRMLMLDPRFVEAISIGVGDIGKVQRRFDLVDSALTEALR